MSFYVYLARCANNSLYCGYCKDLNQRKEAHNNGTGAKYTRANGPVEIVYSESFKTKSEAMKREYQVKQFTKAAKEDLVLSASPPKPQPKYPITGYKV